MVAVTHLALLGVKKQEAAFRGNNKVFVCKDMTLTITKEKSSP